MMPRFNRLVLNAHALQSTKGVFTLAAVLSAWLAFVVPPAHALTVYQSDYTSDDFSCGTLDGAPPTCAEAFTEVEVAGTFAYDATNAEVDNPGGSDTNSVAYVSAVTQTAGAVSAKIRFSSADGGDSGANRIGVLALYDPTGGIGIAAYHRPGATDTCAIAKIDNVGANTASELSNVACTVTDNTKTELRLHISSSNLATVYLGGALKITYQLTASDLTGTGTRWGIYQKNGSAGSANKPATWDDVEVADSGGFGAPAFSVTGTVYTNEGTSNIGTGKTVVIKVNGADACSGACSGTTNASGVYTISNVTASAGAVITVFLSGNTEKGVTVTRSSGNGSNVTGMDIYQNTLIVRHEDAGPITNTDLGQYDKDNNTDVHFASNGNLTVDSDTELHVWTGKTFNPGASVFTTAGGASGNVHIVGSMTAPPVGYSFWVGGSWNNAGTFTHNSNGVTFIATATGKTITTGGSPFYDLTFNSSSGGWTLQDSTTVYDTLKISAGALTTATNLTMGESAGLYNGPSMGIIGAGSFNQTAGSTTIYGDSNIGGTSATVGTCSGTNGSFTFSGLALEPTMFFIPVDRSSYLCGNISVSGNITLDYLTDDTGRFASHSLDGGTASAILTFNGATAFVSDASHGGTFTPSTSTVSYNSTTGATIATTHVTYNNLKIAGTAGQNFLVGGTLTVGGDLTVTTGNLSLNGQNATVSGGDFTVAGSQTVYCGNGNNTCAAGTVTMKGTSATGIGGAGATTLYNLNIGDGTSTAALKLAGNVTTSGDVTVTSSTGLNTFSLNSNSLTVNGGDFLVNSNATGGAETVYCGNGNNTCSAGIVTVDGTGSIGGTGSTLTTYHLYLTGASTTTTFTGNVETKGVFYCGVGTAHVCDTSGSNYSLTVAGNLAIYGPAGGSNAEFKANGSTVTVAGTIWLQEQLGDGTKKGTYTGGTSTLMLTSDSPFLCQLLVKSNGSVDFSTATVKLQNTVTSCVPDAGTFKNLEVGTAADSAAAATYTLRSDTTVSDTLTVGNASSTNTDLLDASTYTLTLSKSGAGITPFVLTSKGDFTASSSTVNYTGTASTVTLAAATYNNLGVGTASDSAAASTFTLGGNTTVGGVLTVGNSGSTNTDVLSGSSRTLTLSKAGGTAGSPITPLVLTSKGSFAYATSTVVYSGASSYLTAAAVDYYYLGCAATGTTLYLGGNTAVNSSDATLALFVRGTTLGGVCTLDTSASGNYSLDVAGGAQFGAASTFGINGAFNANGSTVTIAKVLTLDKATVSEGASTMTIGGLRILSNVGNVWNDGIGALTFGGSSDATPTCGEVGVWCDSQGLDVGDVLITSGSNVTTTNVKAKTVTINPTQGLDISNDTLTLTGSGTPLVNGGIVANFVTTGSTVVYTSATGATIGTTNLSYNNLTIAGTAGQNFLVGGTLTVGGDLTVTTGNLSLNGQNVTVSGGNITGAGTIVCGSSGAPSTCSAGTVTLAGAGNLGGGSFTFYGLTLSGASQTTTFAGDITTKGDFRCGNNTAHTCTMNGYSLDSQSQFEVSGSLGSSAIMNAGTGTITVGGGAYLYNPLNPDRIGTLNGDSSTLVLNNPSATAFFIDLGPGIFAPGSGTVIYSGVNPSGDVTVTATTYHHLKFNAAETYNAGGTVTANGTITMQGGTFEAGANTITGANVEVAGGTLSFGAGSSGGKLKISGSGALSMSSGSIITSDVATPVELTTSDTATPTYVGVSLTGGTLNVAELDVDYLKSTGFVIGSGVTVTAFNNVRWGGSGSVWRGQAASGEVLLDITAQTKQLLNHVFPTTWASNGASDCNVRSNTSGVVTMWDYTGAFGGEDYDCDNSGGEVVWQGGSGSPHGGSGTHQYPAIY